MKSPCVVIGGGLSGLAAAIRLARFIPDVLLLEQHSRLGGLNSYYYRNSRLFETGLHAITNYAEPGDKRAPLNRLFRQLKLNRKHLSFHQQLQSEIHFANTQSLVFTNDFDILTSEIISKFPASEKGFHRLCDFLLEFDPFVPGPFRSAKKFMLDALEDELLVDMLLCPLMYYGSSVENDMDLSQFAIMFQAIYREGFFRPAGTIKDFLDLLADHFLALGGTIKLDCKVSRVIHANDTTTGVELAGGEYIESDYILSTIGSSETDVITGSAESYEEHGRLAFIESIFQLPHDAQPANGGEKTIIFYNLSSRFHYQQPADAVDFRSGVICLPYNFTGIEPQEFIEVRSTHLASYGWWKAHYDNPKSYRRAKEQSRSTSRKVIEKFVGNFSENIVYEDTFTPLTIERYTSKKMGAIYGSPDKIKDGDIGFKNMFLAGTDQGFLGIVGSMLSGVSIVNQHILPKL